MYNIQGKKSDALITIDNLEGDSGQRLYGVRMSKSKREKLVLRCHVSGTVHCGVAVRERAMTLRAIDDIRDLGLIDNSRLGRHGYDLCCQVDFWWPRDRILYYNRQKSWKARCRKRHQWVHSMRSEQRFLWL